MPNDAILEIKQVSSLALSADRTWQGDSNVYLELYRALVTSGMLASISGNAFKVLIAMGLRARILGGDTQGESLFRHLMSLKLVSGADRGKLFCYATQEDLTTDCGLGSRNTLAQAIHCLVDHQLIEKRGRHRQRHRTTQNYVANVYLIRPASSIRKFNAGYTPPRAHFLRTVQSPCSETEHGCLTQMAIPCSESAHGPCAETAHNKKEDEEGEEERISFILGRFAARKGDPDYTPDAQECRKVKTLFHEGYSAEQVATVIDRAFDAHPDNARPVRGFGFIVSYVHRHLRPTNSRAQPLPPSTEDSTEVLTEGISPTGEPTGMTTETKAAVDADITPLQGTSGDPLARVYTLLRAASVQGVEGADDTHYDLPGIRLGLQRFLEMPDPYSGDELYDAVLAAVSRGIQPEHLVGYVEAVLANRRSEHRELERATVHHERQHQGKPQARLDGLLSNEDSPESEDATTRSTSELRSLWDAVSQELEMQMTKATFNTWLKPAQLLAWEPADQGHSTGPARAVIGVPNEYVKDWLKNRLCTPISRTLSGIAGREVEVEFRITDQTKLQNRVQQVKG